MLPLSFRFQDVDIAKGRHRLEGSQAPPDG
jgi:hypothetical protein